MKKLLPDCTKASYLILKWHICVIKKPLSHLMKAAFLDLLPNFISIRHLMRGITMQLRSTHRA